ncbi:MAG: VOC family protein [Hyphococcus sp.]
MSLRAAMDHIVLSASDIDTSVAWYDAFTALLGFHKTRAHVYQHSDGWSIDLRPADADSAAYGRHNPGLNHIGLRAADAATVLALREAFLKKGFDAPEPQVFEDAGAGAETVVFFADPDGVRWEVGHVIGGGV